jgi:hypothetical protein
MELRREKEGRKEAGISVGDLLVPGSLARRWPQVNCQVSDEAIDYPPTSTGSPSDAERGW